MNEADMIRELLEVTDAEIGRLRARVGELEAYRVERDRLYVAYHRLWTKHGDLAEPTVDEVITNKSRGDVRPPAKPLADE